jgi:hypothetical protein
MNGNHPAVKLKLNWQYPAAFLLLEFVCMQAHEIIHHLTGRIVCGAWGAMKFSVFTLSGNCFETNSSALLATAAGPALSYLLMWAGLLILSRSEHRLFGFSLIFANLPFARFVTVLMKGGDEMTIARRFFGDESWAIILCLTVLAVLPPLAMAFKAIGNRRRPLIFAAFLLLPLLFDAVLKRFLLDPLINRWEATATPFFGVPLFIVIVDVLVLTVFVCCRKHLFEKFQHGGQRLRFKTV